MFADTLQLPGLAGRVTAALLGALLAPLVAAAYLLDRGDWRLRRARRLGLDGKPFDELGLDTGASDGLAAALSVARWPALWNVVRGDMALVGPRPRADSEIDPADPRAAELLAVKPGLVCSWWIQHRRRIDYGTELESDLDYARRRGLRTDLGLLARGALAALHGDGEATEARRCRILGVWTDNVSMDAAVGEVAALARREAPSQVCFVNADCLNAACRDAAYRDCLGHARLVLPDGVGVLMASRIAGHSLQQNVNGTDMFPRLCARLADEKRSIYLLGARPGIAQRVREYIEAHHPGLVVAGVHDGYFDAAAEPAVIEEVRGAHPDVLLVAMGAPRQDLWIRDHLRELGAHVAVGVGGLFDFYSFTIPRAPQWVREIGMEWAFRLITEPRRLWKRYVIGNVVFLARVALEQLHLVRYGSPESSASDTANAESTVYS